MKTKDIMTRDVITISGNDTVEQAAKIMLEHRIGGLPVVENGRVIGMFTESDFISKRVDIPHGISSIPELLGHWFTGVSVESILSQASKKPVKEVMSDNIVFVSSSTSLTTTVKIMMDRDLNRLPVIDDGKLVGIIARRDILQAFDRLNN